MQNHPVTKLPDRLHVVTLQIAILAIALIWEVGWKTRNHTLSVYYGLDLCKRGCVESRSRYVHINMLSPKAAWLRLSSRLDTSVRSAYIVRAGRGVWYTLFIVGVWLSSFQGYCTVLPRRCTMYVLTDSVYFHA